eukprot:2172344-Rhodomonas_salina.1
MPSGCSGVDSGPKKRHVSTAQPVVPPTLAQSQPGCQYCTIRSGCVGRLADRVGYARTNVPQQDDTVDQYRKWRSTLRQSQNPKEIGTVLFVSTGHPVASAEDDSEHVRTIEST